MTAKERRRMIIDKLSETIDPEIATAIILGIDLLLIDACREQRELVADELKRYSEDLSIPNQYKINDLCMDAQMPEL